MYTNRLKFISFEFNCTFQRVGIQFVKFSQIRENHMIDKIEISIVNIIYTSI